MVFGKSLLCYKGIYEGVESILARFIWFLRCDKCRCMGMCTCSYRCSIGAGTGAWCLCRCMFVSRVISLRLWFSKNIVFGFFVFVVASACALACACACALPGAGATVVAGACRGARSSLCLLLLRGCSHIMSAKNEGVQTPPTPLSTKYQKLA